MQESFHGQSFHYTSNGTVLIKSTNALMKYTHDRKLITSLWCRKEETEFACLSEISKPNYWITYSKGSYAKNEMYLHYNLTEVLMSLVMKIPDVLCFLIASYTVDLKDPVDQARQIIGVEDLTPLFRKSVAQRGIPEIILVYWLCKNELCVVFMRDFELRGRFVKPLGVWIYNLDSGTTITKTFEFYFDTYSNASVYTENDSSYLTVVNDMDGLNQLLRIVMT